MNNQSASLGQHPPKEDEQNERASGPDTSAMGGRVGLACWVAAPAVGRGLDPRMEPQQNAHLEQAVLAIPGQPAGNAQPRALLLRTLRFRHSD